MSNASNNNIEISSTTAIETAINIEPVENDNINIVEGGPDETDNNINNFAKQSEKDLKAGDEGKKSDHDEVFEPEEYRFESKLEFHSE